MSVEAETAIPRPRRRWLAYAPLIIFMALAWLLFQRLGAGDPASIPSVLIGQMAPPLNLPGLDGAPGLTDADLALAMSAWSTYSAPGASPVISSTNI